MRHLQQEIETYNRRLPELLAQQGKFVLIHGTEVAGTFDSYLEALTAGYQRYKLDHPFLVKQITLVEHVAVYLATPLNQVIEASEQFLATRRFGHQAANTVLFVGRSSIKDLPVAIACAKCCRHV